MEKEFIFLPPFSCFFCRSFDFGDLSPMGHHLTFGSFEQRATALHSSTSLLRPSLEKIQDAALNREKLLRGHAA